MLDTIWLSGIDPLTEEKIPDYSERRALLLEFWLAPADNTYGDAVRLVVEDYLLYMVQVSDHPLLQAEIDSINSRRHCRAFLDIPSPR